MRTFVGVAKRDFAAFRKLVPDYMPMGSAGMAEIGAMHMAMPDNTLPMMTGFGQFGPLEMGGMFWVVKVREGLAAGDYADRGPYSHPAGRVASEFNGDAGETPRPAEKPRAGIAPAPVAEFKVIQPGGKASPSSHEH
jgi:hypothetical protein